MNATRNCVKFHYKFHSVILMASLLENEHVLSCIVEMFVNKIALRIRVSVDDLTSKRAIIASNVSKLRLKN